MHFSRGSNWGSLGLDTLSSALGIVAWLRETTLVTAAAHYHDHIAMSIVQSVALHLCDCIGGAPWHTYGRCHGGSRFGSLQNDTAIHTTRYTICAW